MYTMQRSLRLNDAVVSAELDNQMVLLNVETGLYFGLDELGSLIWSMLTTETSESDIVDQIVAEYDVDRPAVEADVRAFIDSLTAQGLLHADAC